MLMNIAQMTVDCDKTTLDEPQPASKRPQPPPSPELHLAFCICGYSLVETLRLFLFFRAAFGCETLNIAKGTTEPRHLVLKLY